MDPKFKNPREYLSPPSTPFFPLNDCSKLCSIRFHSKTSQRISLLHSPYFFIYYSLFYLLQSGFYHNYSTEMLFEGIKQSSSCQTQWLIYKPLQNQCLSINQHSCILRIFPISFIYISLLVFLLTSLVLSSDL